MCVPEHTDGSSHIHAGHSAHRLVPRIPLCHDMCVTYKVYSLYSHSVGRCGTPSGAVGLRHTEPYIVQVYMSCLWSATTELSEWVSLEYGYSFFLVCLYPVLRALAHTM